MEKSSSGDNVSQTRHIRQSILAFSRMNRKLDDTKPIRRPLIVITGPTATGKTSLGVSFGLQLGAEVVNADARYLYQGFDIGVAKPTLAERKGVPHHLIDILEPTDAMSLALYQDRAYQAIEAVLEKGNQPLLVGGSPQYVNAVAEGWKIPRVPPDPVFRKAMEAEIETFGISAVSIRLRQVDPESADRCGVNPRRIIRALEIYEATGQPMAKLQSKGPARFETLQLGLTLPREELYRRIDARVDMQIEQGLVEEVSELLNNGVLPEAPAFSAIGYRQLVPYLTGEITLEEAISDIKHATHRFVRHQQTWLRKNRLLIPIDVSQDDWQEQAVERVVSFLKASGAGV